MLSYSSSFIKTLDLRGLRNLHGAHFSSALSPLGPFRFQRIDLRGCRKLGTEAINHLLEQCSELQYLNLKGLHAVEASTLQVVARSNPLLQSLNLSRCFNISFCDLVIFLQSLQDSRITEFRIANLKGYGPTSDKLLPTIAQCLPLLEILDVQGSPHIFDGGFRDFAAEYVKVGRACGIKHLNLSSCSMLTGGTLLHLAPHLGHLEILELAGYGDRLQDAGLVAVIKRTPRLRKLDLDYATAITDAVLDVLAASKEVDDEVVGSCLDTLVLSYAKGLTADGILRLIRGCPALISLDLDVSSSDRSRLMAEY
jgi:F-box/leucine-rich repeat protein 2/20